MGAVPVCRWVARDKRVLFLLCLVLVVVEVVLLALVAKAEHRRFLPHAHVPRASPGQPVHDYDFNYS